MAVRETKKSFADISSGMAGFVTAYLVQNDCKQRYDMEVFEMQDRLSLDSALCFITPVDILMRAFDDGFHNTLKRMYDHLDIKYTSAKFIYPISTVSTTDGKKMSPHFIHSSSNHQVPLIRPENCGYVEWILRTLYLVVCYFCKNYLLLLILSIAICFYNKLLKFPAIDAVDYARRTYCQPHYIVIGGEVLSSIPVIHGESFIHRDRSTIPYYKFIYKYPSSVLVKSFPITSIDPAKVIHRARLTRVLQILKSRKIINKIFSEKSKFVFPGNIKIWHNKIRNIWLGAAWC
ncbi:NAD(P)-binding protein [Aspergillus alliaceus]|uniref:NAD(P)-binding protein n=1 Tax=Petromyces alliaceus TaxID=209559 RepID=UPI0012A6AA91|nr:uncharacterized protein BDW43DRAFT_304983 [Aspergillus alliaceus]KAB8226941.1 hypothetical protein BDW43DRAFT_304983 [Aspergillus alliaceus]